MKAQLGSVLILLLAVSCGRDSTVQRERAEDYEVVQEGSASGVATSLAGPGEVMPPVTGTNVDTTTDFTLNPNGLPPPAAPAGSLAGTLPTSEEYGIRATPPAPPMTSSVPAPRPATAQPAAPAEDPIPSNDPSRESETAPPDEVAPEPEETPAPDDEEPEPEPPPPPPQ